MDYIRAENQRSNVTPDPFPEVPVDGLFVKATWETCDCPCHSDEPQTYAETVDPGIASAALAFRQTNVGTCASCMCPSSR